MINDIVFFALIALVIALVFALVWVIMLKKRILKRRNHFEWVMSASDMYLFEYDVKNDELWFSPQCAKLMDVPLCIQKFHEVMQTTKDSTLKRGLGYANKVLACQKDTGRLELLDPEGNMGIYEVQSKSFHDKKGELVCRVGILVDITRQTRAKEAQEMAESESETGVLGEDMVRYLVSRTLNEQSPHEQGAYALLSVDALPGGALEGEQGKKLLHALSLNLHAAMRGGDSVGLTEVADFCFYLPNKMDEKMLGGFTKRMHKVVRESLQVFLPDGEGLGIHIAGVLIQPGDTYEALTERTREVLERAKKTKEADSIVMQ